MATAPESAGINPLDVIRVLRTAGSALLKQAALHGQLVRVEWEAEKDRIAGMAVAALIAFASLLCTMLMAGALALALAGTPYRIPVAIAWSSSTQPSCTACTDQDLSRKARPFPDPRRTLSDLN